MADTADSLTTAISLESPFKIPLGPDVIPNLSSPLRSPQTIRSPRDATPDLRNYAHSEDTIHNNVQSHPNERLSGSVEELLSNSYSNMSPPSLQSSAHHRSMESSPTMRLLSGDLSLPPIPSSLYQVSPGGPNGNQTNLAPSLNHQRLTSNTVTISDSMTPSPGVRSPREAVPHLSRPTSPGYNNPTLSQLAGNLVGTNVTAPPGVTTLPTGIAALNSSSRFNYDNNIHRDRSSPKYDDKDYIESSRHRKHRSSKHRKDRSPLPLPNNVPPGVKVPKDHVYVETDYGSYIIPRYDDMTPEEQIKRRSTLNLQFEILRDSWKHYGIKFDMPGPDETLPNMAIRYKQYVRYIMAKSGADLYKLLLVLFWLAIEFVCVKIGLKASGYTMMQLELYDLYHTMLIEMGEAQGFGEGWAPWIRILVISVVTAVAFILLNVLIGNGSNQSGAFTRLLAQFVTGNISNVTTANNDLEVPQPDPTGGLGSLGSALGAGGLGGIDISTVLAKLGTMMSGNIQQKVQTSQQSSNSGSAQSSQEQPSSRRRDRPHRRPTWNS